MSGEKEYIFSMICPNGFTIECEDDLVAPYVVDRKVAEETKDLNSLINKWQYVAPSLVGKTSFDDDVMVPPELLRIALFAKRYVVPDGVILFQTINSGFCAVDEKGYVRNNPDFKKEPIK